MKETTIIQKLPLEKAQVYKLKNHWHLDILDAAAEVIREQSREDNKMLTYAQARWVIDNITNISYFVSQLEDYKS